MDYDTLAPGYDSLYEQEQMEKLEVLKKHLSVKKSDKLLDVGCGTGISTCFFDCDAFGVDPSPEMVKNGKGNLLVAAAEALPFKDDSFNIVISITAIHNFEDYKKAFSEMKRVLKPSGKIAISIMKKSKKCEEIKNFLMASMPFCSLKCGKDVLLVS